MLPESCEFSFCVTKQEMEVFASLSDDYSLIHTDAAFARLHGFREPIVYGGILLAKLSHCLGTRLPGPTGVSLEWLIRYHSPLYVDEAALFRAESRRFSEALQVLELVFRVTCGDRKIASGTAQSRILGSFGFLDSPPSR